MSETKTFWRFVVGGLLALWLSAPTVHAQATVGGGKQVTLNLKTATIKDFFNQVKKQTGLNFIYSSDLCVKS